MTLFLHCVNLECPGSLHAEHIRVWLVPRKILHSSSSYFDFILFGMMIFGEADKYTALSKLLQCLRRGLVYPAISTVVTERVSDLILELGF